MGFEIGGTIEKVNGKELSYNEFVERYLSKNQPVVLTGLMDDWRACKDWVFDNGKPNLKFFSTHFGNSKVQVADCGTRDFTDQKRVEMTVSEFIDHWTDAKECGGASNSFQEDNGKSVLYLKDWHFVKPIASGNYLACMIVPSNLFPGQLFFTYRALQLNTVEHSVGLDLLLRDYKEAKEYIEDIRDISDDFEGLCQRNLAANTAGNHGFFLDLMEMLDDPNFLQLCIDMGRTYGIIHEQQNCSCDTKKAWMVEFLDCSSHIHNLEDLVKFIDYSVAKLTATFCEEKFLESGLNSWPLVEDLNDEALQFSLLQNQG
ncbi:unnamed protein product [Dovyalis caffra]|uniref:JmjC domain-containing protein n=1 Tax=Dovyalis caffra TaxID=77055 RepID=A0AAV1QQ26_9ROSI|nr:unnamed protein product [Dovyalis caffra]